MWNNFLNFITKTNTSTQLILLYVTKSEIWVFYVWTMRAMRALKKFLLQTKHILIRNILFHLLGRFLIVYILYLSIFVSNFNLICNVLKFIFYSTWLTSHWPNKEWSILNFFRVNVSLKALIKSEALYEGSVISS